MSTAVLEGCGLHDWVATDEHSYVQLAVEQAANLKDLRVNRDRWRTQIQKSPLGDASDLASSRKGLYRYGPGKLSSS